MQKIQWKLSTTASLATEEENPSIRTTETRFYEPARLSEVEALIPHGSELRSTILKLHKLYLR